MIFQLLTICEDKVKLNIELDRIRKEKIESEVVIVDRHTSNKNQIASLNSSLTLRSRNKIRDTIKSSSSTRQVTESALVSFDGSRAGYNKDNSEDSENSACDTERDLSDVGAYGGMKQPMIASVMAEELQHSFRRHSFAVGYFIDEGQTHFHNK